MPLFRRRAAESEPLAFTVGVGDHRVVVGGDASGCALLEDVDQYAAFIARRSKQRDGERDSVGVLNAKLDYAELVDTMVSVLVLAFEELTERGVMTAGEVPQKPAVSPLRRDLTTHEHIQGSYERALVRAEWARRADALLRDRGIAVLWPQT